MGNRWAKLFLGLNGAAVLRGLRLGAMECVRGCSASLAAVQPLEDRKQHLTKQLLNSIPEVSLDQILGSQTATIRLNVQRYEDGMLPPHEALVLLAILLVENPTEVLEIGTYMGHTTRAMAENLPHALIHTVDLPAEFSLERDVNSGPPKDDFHLIRRRDVGREFRGHPVAARIRQHLGDTATIDFREFGQPTFFFIDGSHTYEYCKQDSEKCLRLCCGTAVFLWHDCDTGHPGVVRFLAEWKSQGRSIQRIHGTTLAYWKTIRF